MILFRQEKISYTAVNHFSATFPQALAKNSRRSMITSDFPYIRYKHAPYPVVLFPQLPYTAAQHSDKFN